MAVSFAVQTATANLLGELARLGDLDLLCGLVAAVGLQAST